MLDFVVGDKNVPTPRYLEVMFIRRTRTRADGGYFTFRLVRSERIGDKIRQHTLPDLGRHFDVAQCDWRRLADASTKSSPASCPCPRRPPELEAHAQRITAALPAGDRVGAASPPPDRGHDFQHVHADSPEVLRPRPVGVEHAGLWATEKLALPDLLERPGIAPSLRTAAVGSIISRMACPGSERATRRRLAERSALGELPGTDLQTMGPMRPYRASDALMAHRGAIERHLFDLAMGLFGLQRTVTLYDLTNTPAGMPDALGAPPYALVVMDRGAEGFDFAIRLAQRQTPPCVSSFMCPRAASGASTMRPAMRINSLRRASPSPGSGNSVASSAARAAARGRPAGQIWSVMPMPHVLLMHGIQRHLPERKRVFDETAVDHAPVPSASASARNTMVAAVMCNT